MKKKLKIFLSVFVIVLLAAGSYLLYIFKFKEYDVADDEVAQIVSDPYEVELPDGSKLVIEEDGTVTTVGGGESDETTSGTTTTAGGSTAGVTPPSQSGSNSSTSSKDDTSKDNSSNEGSATEDKGSEGNGGTGNVAKKPTVADIKAKYEPVFSQLEGQADQKINSLIGRAKKEYSDKKANGESVNYAYFYNKYMGAATSLEENTDSIFHGVVKAVEAELEANGYSKSYAQSFVDHYEATKKARRDSIISKATGK